MFVGLILAQLKDLGFQILLLANVTAYKGYRIILKIFDVSDTSVR
jgi:hypothetical protein